VAQDNAKVRVILLKYKSENEGRLGAIHAML
jgi:hypothetical protein